ncbi:MAG: T9SS type A sorting domain-containing protein [Bacteroidaceae bacterium]|nr:T9SS type A sorting domain-containing protein [Bacteroidaceae bacterium]
MKTFRLLLLVLLLLPTGLKAQTSGQATQQLVVWLTDGTKVYHDLADEPTTTFAGGALYINSATVAVSYPIERVLRYTYEGVMTAVAAPIVNPGEVRFTQGSDQMAFDGLAAGTRIDIYSPDGKLLRTQTAEQGQTAVVSFTGMPQGIYIVKAGDASYKFLKR